MKVLRFVLRYSKGTLLVAFLCGLISGICSTGLLVIVNTMLHHGTSPFVRLSYLYIVLALAVPVTRGLSEISLIFLSQNTLCQLRVELSQRALTLPLRDLEKMGPDKVLAALTADLPNIADFISLVPLFSINMATALSCLVYLGFLDLHFLLVICGFLAVGVLTYQFPVIRAIGNLRKARQEQDTLLDHFQSLLHGAKELKLHRKRRSAFMDTLLVASADRLRKLNLRGFAIYTLASVWGQLLAFIVVGVLVSRMFGFARADDQTLTGLVLVLFYVISPLQVMMDLVPMMGRANVSAANIDQLGLALGQSVNDHETGQEGDYKTGWRSLKVAGMTYTYFTDEEQRFVLGPIDLEFQPGQIVFIAGGNGSGKTTLAKVLAGLYIPETGDIVVDGTKITDAGRDDYRQNFSVVFWDFHLFDQLLGLDDANLDESANDYLKRLQLGNKITVRDGKLSSTEVSQGQRKRLALLTAYLEDRPIYIFDEWAADQDPMFKELFYRSILLDLRERGKTVIVISHDERYYDVGDRVVRLEAGVIVSDVACRGKEDNRGVLSSSRTPRG